MEFNILLFPIQQNDLVFLNKTYDFLFVDHIKLLDLKIFNIKVYNNFHSLYTPKFNRTIIAATE